MLSMTLGAQNMLVLKRKRLVDYGDKSGWSRRGKKVVLDAAA
jgi:hypothetical protein